MQVACDTIMWPGCVHMWPGCMIRMWPVCVCNLCSSSKLGSALDIPKRIPCVYHCQTVLHRLWDAPRTARRATQCGGITIRMYSPFSILSILSPRFLRSHTRQQVDQHTLSHSYGSLYPMLHHSLVLSLSLSSIYCSLSLSLSNILLALSLSFTLSLSLSRIYCSLSLPVHSH